MLKYHAFPIDVKPATTADVQNNLTVSNRKIIDTLVLGETVRLHVVPCCITHITLVEIDVDDAAFKTGCFYDTGMFFFHVYNVKEIENTIGKNHSYKRLVDGF